ncbi:TIGR04255 family protein [Mycobacterium kansasii]|uniref:TIGR04255 family protein n=2 Tax=Mycobacterium kansasii TaxID=1768 RepID=A0A1V3WPP6_MYCKA|nr:TIGR04255 family protein [Mycobacterium kansasii]
MYPNREVFPKAPLALVTTEIRFTDSPRLRQQETLDAVAIALEDRFPLNTPQTSVTFNVGSLGPGVLPQVEQERRVVLTNTTRTESVTITPSSFICETTAYREFDDFRVGVTAVCEALIDANVRPALVRVGLRYIDEVRVPEPITDVRAWAKWIDDGIIRPLTIGPDDVAVRNVQGLVTFDLGDGKGLNFQYAALNQTPVVQPQFLNRGNLSLARSLSWTSMDFATLVSKTWFDWTRMKSLTSSRLSMTQRAPCFSVQLRRMPETYFEEGPHDGSCNDALDPYRYKRGRRYQRLSNSANWNSRAINRSRRPPDANRLGR